MLQEQKALSCQCLHLKLLLHHSSMSAFHMDLSHYGVDAKTAEASKRFKRSRKSVVTGCYDDFLLFSGTDGEPTVPLITSDRQKYLQMERVIQP